MNKRANAVWQIEAIRKQHVRDRFRCGNAELDRYLRRYARQSEAKSTARTFVAARPGEQVVCGYYTLSASVVAFSSLPPERARGLPNPVPAALLGRLAVDRSAQGQGLGRLILADALKRTLEASRELGIYAVAVDAVDDMARGFYRKYGFESLRDDPLHMFLSMKAVREAFP